MVFDRTVRTELQRTFGATLVVILTIVLTMMLIRTLAQAAGGAIAPDDVVLLLAFLALAQLPTMIALSLFFAVVVTLGRMYRDSEMVVWFSSGVGLGRFVRPVLRTAAPLLAAAALLLVWAWPQVNQAATELRDRYAQRSDLSRVAPGQFQSSADGRSVFYIDSHVQGSGEGRNVFVLQRDGRREAVTSAGTGRLVTTDAGRTLVLEHGQRAETDATSGARTMASFERYALVVDERAAAAAGSRPPRAMPTLDLLRSREPAEQAELAWRFGMSWAGVNLVLMGIALAATPVRRASNWNLLFALLTFIVYFNLISFTQSRIGAGRVGLWPALIGLHGAVLLLAAALIRMRARGAVGVGWAARLRRLVLAGVGGAR